jgi:hypothetical protein
LSAAAFEAAMAASAMLAATSEQDLACSEFLRVCFMIWFWFGFVFVNAAWTTRSKHLHADCDESV